MGEVEISEFSSGSIFDSNDADNRDNVVNTNMLLAKSINSFSGCAVSESHLYYPPVAQLDNAQAYEASGWEFESLRADHMPLKLI